MLRYVADRSESAHYSVVAGWLGPVNLWEQQEIDWRIALAKFDVPYFHMKEFAHSIGPLAKCKGKEGTRQNLLTALVDVIHWRSLYGIGCVVDRRDIQEVNREYELLGYFKDPYVICAAQCMGLTRQRERVDFANHDIEYILEHGDAERAGWSRYPMSGTSRHQCSSGHGASRVIAQTLTRQWWRASAQIFPHGN